MMIDPRRRELGAFLRSRRERLERAALDLPPLPRGRSRGLRREEVAVASGVSITWYTWLEQGRDIHPSRQVLTAVSRALRLTDAERDYVLELVGYAPPRPAGVTPAPAHLQKLLDALGHPAYILAQDWGVAGWNQAYERLYPHIGEAAPQDRNLLWLVFTDPYVRSLLDDWEMTSRRFLAEFRAETGRRGDPETVQLIEALAEASPEFRVWWDSYDIGGFESRERVFHLDDGSTVRYEHHQLRPSDRPDLQIVAYTPVEAGPGKPDGHPSDIGAPVKP